MVCGRLGALVGSSYVLETPAPVVASGDVQQLTERSGVQLRSWQFGPGRLGGPVAYLALTRRPVQVNRLNVGHPTGRPPARFPKHELEPDGAPVLPQTMPLLLSPNAASPWSPQFGK